MEEDKTVYYGTVIFFSNKTGYGFLQWEKDGIKQDDIFVHWSDINSEGYKTLQKDQKVSFQIGLNKRGQPKGILVTVLQN